MSPDLKSVYAVGSDRTLKEINLNEATVSNSLLAAPAIVCIFKVIQKFTKSPCRYFVKIGQSPYTIVHGLWSKMAKREFSIFIIFLMHIHVLMLCRKFELIPIKFGFLRIFKVAQKSGQSPCTIVQGLRPDFIKND